MSRPSFKVIFVFEGSNRINRNFTGTGKCLSFPAGHCRSDWWPVRWPNRSRIRRQGNRDRFFEHCPYPCASKRSEAFLRPRKPLLASRHVQRLSATSPGCTPTPPLSGSFKHSCIVLVQARVPTEACRTHEKPHDHPSAPHQGSFARPGKEEDEMIHLARKADEI